MAKKFMFVALGLIPLAGVFAGFGAWAAIGANTAWTGSVVGGAPTIEERLLGIFTAIFFGGVTIGAIVLYTSFIRDTFWPRKRKSND